MPGRSIDDLVVAGLLRAKPPDRPRVSRWLERSHKDLELAANLLADVDRDRAMAVAYEAGYRACAGILDLAGYRVTSQPGHHRGYRRSHAGPRRRAPATGGQLPR